MTKFIVFDKPEEQEPVVWLNLEAQSDGGVVLLTAVDSSGVLKTLLRISGSGVRRIELARVDGLPFDEAGRIKLVE